MIRTGLDNKEKRREIEDYCKNNFINQIFVFHSKFYPLEININNTRVEYIEYDDIIMYKYFYWLLEIIDENSLLIFNECLRTQNRSELTYNCAHHYCNQTPHKIVFEFFPFIEEKNDFMILLDFINKGKYKGYSFEYDFLKEEDIKVKPHNFTVYTIDVPITKKEIDKYENKKEKMFAELDDESDPDNIPRNLHVFAGNFKKPLIYPDENYVARNKRFKMQNVTTYKEIEEGKFYKIIDFPHRRIDFNDFLKKTGIRDIIFINSTLKVDIYYLNELKEWIKRLGEFYDKANIYR